MKDISNINKTDYSLLSDENIVSIIHSGDELAQEFLINKYKNFVKIKSRTYFLIGGDREDIIQEGMIGLYKAIRDFNVEKNVKFCSFAKLCVTRQIITAIKSATRQKHIPLNSYISLNKPIDENENEHSFIDLLSETTLSDPENMLIDKENKTQIEKHIVKELSEFECQVLYIYLQGGNYSEIAHKTDKNEKAIDNAIQRIRKKVDKIVKSL